MVMNVPLSISEGHFLNPYCVPFPFKKIVFDIHHDPFTKPSHVITIPPIN